MMAFAGDGAERGDVGEGRRADAVPSGRAAVLPFGSLIAGQGQAGIHEVKGGGFGQAHGGVHHPPG